MIRTAAVFAVALGFATSALANDKVSYFPVKQGSGPHDVAVGADGKVDMNTTAALRRKAAE
jgi:streptogramin lyase